jgi:hypothetical protein
MLGKALKFDLVADVDRFDSRSQSFPLKLDYWISGRHYIGTLKVFSPPPSSNFTPYLSNYP